MWNLLIIAILFYIPTQRAEKVNTAKDLYNLRISLPDGGKRHEFVKLINVNTPEEGLEAEGEIIEFYENGFKGLTSYKIGAENYKYSYKYQKSDADQRLSIKRIGAGALKSIAG